MKPQVTEARIHLMSVPDLLDESKGSTGAEILAQILRTMAEVSGEPEDSVRATCAVDIWTGGGSQVLGAITARQTRVAADLRAVSLAKLAEDPLRCGPFRFFSVVEHLRLTAPRQSGPSGQWRPPAFPALAAAGLRALAALDHVEPATCEVSLIQEVTPDLETVEVSHAAPGEGVRLDEILSWEQAEVTRWQS